MNIFWELRSNLPREVPGDPASTARAYAAAIDLPPRPQILDIGCGPGMQTLDLARLSRGEIIAIDFHQPFLDELARRAGKAGLEKQIQARKLSMFEMDFAPGQFDLVWSEGAIYIMGFEQGFKACRPFLKPGRYMAVTRHPGSRRIHRRKFAISGTRLILTWARSTRISKSWKGRDTGW